MSWEHAVPLPWIVGLFGALVGSFLNVVIHRVPRAESLISPPSHCPACGKNVRAFDNVPILSWLFLRGKCRHCKKGISPRYPAVEAVTAVLFAFAATQVTSFVALGFAMFFLAAMIVITFIDLDHMIIPDSITLPGIGIGLLAAWLTGIVDIQQSLLGILVGGGSLLAVAYGYKLATGREGLGGGDIKLLGMVGAFVGPVGAFLTIMIGSVAGTLFAVAFMMRTGKNGQAELPFGTFLAPGAVVVFLWGAWIVKTYWGFFS